MEYSLLLFCWTRDWRLGFAFPDDPQSFELTFRLAENYPVDLYYLMDLSNSMADDKEKLASLGVKISGFQGFPVFFLVHKVKANGLSINFNLNVHGL